MSKINFNYVVTSVDTDEGLMDVTYTSSGLQTVQSRMRIPFETETLDEVVRSFAPMHIWDQVTTPLAVVEVGTSGRGEVSNFVPPTADEVARARRNRELMLSDWTQLPDAALSPEARESWAAYRQALRDIPEQAGFPDTIVWPEQGGV